MRVDDPATDGAARQRASGDDDVADRRDDVADRRDDVDGPRRGRRSPIVTADVVGTGVFVVVLLVGVLLHDDRPGQAVVIATSMVLFAAGAASCLWAYTSALERSRAEEIGVANIFLLTGRTAPRTVKRAMSSLLALQVVAAVVAASVGAARLSGDELNALAFGVLVPMFGLGMNGLYASRHGSFGPRIATAPKSKRRVD